MYEQSTKLDDVKYKIVLLGPSSVGKSAIIERFIQANFDPNKSETVGIDFLVKNIQYKGAQYRLQLWDTAGQEKFKSLVPNYIRDAHCAVFVYDIARKQTFKEVDVWLELFKECHAGDAVSILVGNKTDKKERREVERQEGQEKARDCGISFCETSACSGQGIEQLFFSIIENIQAPRRQQDQPEELMTSPAEQKLNMNKFESSGSMNKTRLVKIQPQRRKFMCCYI